MIVQHRRPNQIREGKELAETAYGSSEIDNSRNAEHGVIN
jgi:hypothetical protein